MKCEMILLWEKNNDQKNNDQLRNKMRNANVMKKEEGSKEQWSIEKWNGKCYCYERRRRIKRTMINWEVKSEVRTLWEKKKDQKNNNQLRSEIWSGIMMREEEGSKEQ
jgi:hypothetical protein